MAFHTFLWFRRVYYRYEEGNNQPETSGRVQTELDLRGERGGGEEEKGVESRPRGLKGARGPNGIAHFMEGQF